MNTKHFQEIKEIEKDFNITITEIRLETKLSRPTIRKILDENNYQNSNTKSFYSVYDYMQSRKKKYLDKLRSE